MKQYTWKSAGYSFSSPGPATVEEYDQIAGGPGKCLEDAVDNEIYRGLIPAFWAKAIPQVVALTGIALGVDDKATAKAKARAKDEEAAAKVKDVPERFGNYMGRVEAQLHEDKDALKEIEELLKRIASETAIDPSPASRAKGPGKDYLEKADSILALPADKVEVKVATILEVVPDFVFERDENGLPTRDSLALGVKAWFAAS